MDVTAVTIALEDNSGGYEISPGRVPLAVLTAFTSEVSDFLKGSGRDSEADAIEISVQTGSLEFAASNISSHSLNHDLQAMFLGPDISSLDPKRRAVIEKWQQSAWKSASRKIKIAAPTVAHAVVIDNLSDFRVIKSGRLVSVERYIHGEIQDLGGLREPNAHIKLPDGRTLKVRTDRKLIQAEPKNLVYHEVHMRISATLNLDTGELTDATLLEFVDYHPRFDEAQFSKLVDNGRKAWQDIEDPAQWVRKLRGDE